MKIDILKSLDNIKKTYNCNDKINMYHNTFINTHSYDFKVITELLKDDEIALSYIMSIMECYNHNKDTFSNIPFDYLEYRIKMT